MEDRKRPALSATDEIAPPSKRQAINGATKSRDDGDLRDEAWIEDYQKDAIYRQMLQYKRELSTIESRLEEATKRSTYHDDHLRVVDQWWLQLLQEVELAAKGSIDTDLESKDFAILHSTVLLFKGQEEFHDHLRDKTKVIKSRLETLFGLISGGREVKPEVAELESQISKHLATIKDLSVKLDRSNAEKEALSEQLDTATLRYVKAEKRLDRAKSAQVQKLEQQALKNATVRQPSAEHTTEDSGTNGNTEALQLKCDEAVAVASKQKEQLAAAMAEIKALQEENTSLKARKETVSEEDYARTDLFKHFKAQNEELIKRVNGLEVTNRQLREEAEKFQTERTTYREQLNREAQTVTAELEEQLYQKDQDLTRIRSIRDDLTASLTIQKAKADQERTSSEHIKELLSAKDDRIAGLELELERLRPNEDAAMSTPREDLEALSTSDLITRYVKLEKDFALIKSEIPSVEKAYKKAVALSQKKITDLAALESKVVSLAAEKNKAEQKYFAARRDTDARINENKTLQLQNKTSSTIISQLKDVEAHTKTLVANLEKQLAELKQSNVSLLEENRKIKAASADAVRQHESLKSQASNLGNLVKAKDSAVLSLKEKAAAHETELEKVKVKLEHVQRERDNYKSRGSSDSEENLRKFALCNVCNGNFKNVTLKTCGHVFCNECVESRVANRRRKCPTCGKAFDKMDVMHIHM